ncbi:phosphate transport regulator related to PhoU [Thermobacillus composti KWC4]|uniref:Phosphate transport regulator related to PhoU n=2 Tax=Paenibacillaceae TaxID=186822 RepID=L0EAR6_THECK|nr:phosphate transport regulator related to PhoU [Thermobacillus composti KWC4]
MAKGSSMFNRKKSIFFQTFEEMADTIVEAVEYFHKHVPQLTDLTSFARDMKEFESKCDRHVHTILTELNKTFITPIDRDDILKLTGSLDDVLDGIEALASRFEMYQIREHDKYVSVFAEILVKCSHEIRKAVQLLSQKKLLAMRQHAIAINELENEADDLMRECIKSLFSSVTDPIELMKRKEIYERLESTTDYCEDVANTLETIIMRNS